MKLSETNYDNSETGCCARLDASRWDAQQFEWQDKLFLRDHVRSFLHAPLNYGSVIRRDLDLIEKAEAYPCEPITLLEPVSPSRSHLLIAVDREIPDEHFEKLSGTFITRVFEGRYHKTATWMREMDEYVAGKGHAVDKTYSFFATCPSCARHYGANRVVLFARIA